MNISTVLGIVLTVLQILLILFGGARFFISLSSRLKKLENEYKPNGGSSMRDAINRIENKLSKLEGQFEQHIKEDN